MEKLSRKAEELKLLDEACERCMEENGTDYWMPYYDAPTS